MSHDCNKCPGAGEHCERCSLMESVPKGLSAMREELHGYGTNIVLSSKFFGIEDIGQVAYQEYTEKVDRILRAMLELLEDVPGAPEFTAAVKDFNAWLPKYTVAFPEASFIRAVIPTLPGVIRDTVETDLRLWRKLKGTCERWQDVWDNGWRIHCEGPDTLPDAFKRIQWREREFRRLQLEGVTSKDALTTIHVHEQAKREATAVAAATDKTKSKPGDDKHQPA
jgi:hypothetical protein